MVWGRFCYGYDDMRESIYIDPEKLTIGMFVILEISWLRHPFTFSSFVIRSEEQLATIRGLGLKEVRIDPLRSQFVVASPKPGGGTVAEAKVGGSAGGSTAADFATAEKLLRVEKNMVLRSNIADAEKHAARAAQTVRQATKQFGAKAAESIAVTEALITEIAESLLGSSEAMVHLLGDKVAGEEIYYHSLNVAMLALLLGKSLKMDSASLQTIGMAAIFHDLGKDDIPSRVLLKTDPLTHAEEALIRQHPQVGAQMAVHGQLPAPVVAAILQHHENIDGSGYPNRLRGDTISPAAKVIAIVNHYDNLCNPVNVAKALTPYEALSTMFAKRKGWFDQGMLGRLVHILGVYPPGSVVQLSSGVTGMVISVNSAKPLQPSVLVYDASVPKNEAIIIDLEKMPEVSISKALRPASLAPSVYEYLNPRKRVTYYFGDHEAPD